MPDFPIIVFTHGATNRFWVRQDQLFNCPHIYRLWGSRLQLYLQTYLKLPSTYTSSAGFGNTSHPHHPLDIFNWFKLSINQLWIERLVQEPSKHGYRNLRYVYPSSLGLRNLSAKVFIPWRPQVTKSNLPYLRSSRKNMSHSVAKPTPVSTCQISRLKTCISTGSWLGECRQQIKSEFMLG